MTPRAVGEGTARPEFTRGLLGHSALHIRNCSGKPMRLHLVRIDDEKGTGKRVIFLRKDLVHQARRIA